jgi:hypothetical protein
MLLKTRKEFQCLLNITSLTKLQQKLIKHLFKNLPKNDLNLTPKFTPKSPQSHPGSPPKVLHKSSKSPPKLPQKSSKCPSKVPPKVGQKSPQKTLTGFPALKSVPFRILTWHRVDQGTKIFQAQDPSKCFPKTQKFPLDFKHNLSASKTSSS